MPFDDDLRRLAPRLPQGRPPEELKGRIMGRIAASSAVSSTRQRAAIPAKLRLAAVAAMVLFGVAFSYWVGRSPHGVGGSIQETPLPISTDAVVLIDTSAAANQISGAIQRTVTWHFVGWRYVDGQTKRWEVWGRRSPYFYEEKIGNETVIVDNAPPIRWYLLPRAPRQTYMRGTRPSLRPHASQLPSGMDAAALLTNLSAESCRRDIVPNQTGRNIVLESHKDWVGRIGIRDVMIVEVDRGEHLPVSFRVERREYGRNKSTHAVDFSPKTLISKRAVAQLLPAYDMPLPKDVGRLPRPLSGPVTLDYTANIGSAINAGISRRPND